MPMTWKQIPAKQVKLPTLSVEEVFDVVHRTKSSVGPEEVERCHEWTRQYGVDGS
jgi:vacuolar protein-sorting-associated protein 4